METLAFGSISAKRLEAEGLEGLKYKWHGSSKENEALTRLLEEEEVPLNEVFLKYWCALKVE